MNTLIQSYGFDYEQFRYILYKTGGMIAGSSALAEYLKQNGINPGYEPNDIDIWVYDNHYSHKCSRCNTDSCYSNINILSKFMINNGFILTETNKDYKIVEEGEEYDLSLSKIECVKTFTNRNGKTIQIILVHDFNIQSYIKYNFDLSICTTWWDVNDELFYTACPELTLKKQMFFNSKDTISKTDPTHLKERIDKYVSSGFTLIETPCPYQIKLDTRDNIEKTEARLQNVMGFDIVNYEDVSVIDYLKQSSWHIAIKVNESYHLFHRKQLYDCMKQKRTRMTQFTQIYDTPFNQSISSEALETLMFSDYSIYELIFRDNANTKKGIKKAIYTVRCYSINDWITGSADITTTPCIPDIELYRHVSGSYEMTQRLLRWNEWNEQEYD